MSSRNPFARRGDWRDWAVAAIVAVALLAMLLWLVASAGGHPDLAALFTEPSSAPLEPVTTSTPVGTTSTPVAISANAPLPGVTRAYVCRRGSATTYSDRPCEAGAQTTDVDPSRLNGYAPSAVDRVYVPVEPAVVIRGESPGNGPVSPPDELCRTIGAEVAALDARMRQGYTSSEGEWFRARWHALKEQRHSAGCDWPGR